MAENNLITRYKADNSDFTKKTNEAKRSLEQFGLKGTEVGKKMSSLTSALNINVGTLSKLSVGLGAASAALKVAGDALKQNEQIMDEWGRVTKSAESLYKGFLNAINTGNISGYLQNMNNIVKAARAAYDAMDDLGTFNAFNQINDAKHQANFTEALANFKAGTGSKSDIINAADAVKSDLIARRKEQQNAYLSAINDLAAQRGVNSNLLRDVLMGSDENFRRVKGLGLSKTETTIVGSGINARIGTKQVAGNAMEKIGEMLRSLTDEELKNLQALGAAAEQTSREINNVDKQVARYINDSTGGGSGSGRAGTSIDKPWSKLKGKYTDSMKSLSTISGGSISSGVAAVTGGVDTTNLEKQWSDLQRLSNIAAMAKENAEGAANAFTQIGAALTSIKDPGAKVLGIVSMAIANVALAFSKSIGSSLTVWDYIAGAAAGIATMYTTIDAIKEATEYHANGGMVGMSKGTDTVPAMLTPGEIVLNSAQQRNVAQSLRNSSQERQMQPYLNAETIYLGLSNYLRRSGRGEIVTTR